MADPKPDSAKKNKYAAIISEIFKRHHKQGCTSFEFSREEMDEIASEMAIVSNLGDAIYTFRYRTKLPKEIVQSAKSGYEWIIEGAGRSKYRMIQKPIQSLEPQSNRLAIKIPDATPEIVTAYATSDEQALLARVRYNRLVDIFLGITAYSLQNHLRSTVRSIGQIEIDEIYIGVDKQGAQYIIPVQAKGGNDHHSVVQSSQDIYWCRAKFPDLICRAVSAQSMKDNRIVMFELTLEGEEIRLVEERHYLLTPSSEISQSDLQVYARSRHI